MRKILSTLAVSLLCACGASPQASAPPHLDLPVPPVHGATAGPAAGARQAPPSSLASKPSPFPSIARSSLDNGLRVAVVPARALPIVQIRVVIGAGIGYGGPGAAQLTGEMLKEGGTRAMTSAQVMTRIETLGASLSVDVDFDRTTLGLGVTKSHLDEALALLAQVAMDPRFDSAELRKLKARRTDEAREAARGSGSWSATRLLFKELYAPTNPYSNYDLVPSEIAKINEQTLRDFHKR
ncbi:MAG TPA: insulinase family protein, partial [Polyangiaceae bacterium]|nr:insulinase family protein [Polyangiaceae bacterium]